MFVRKICAALGATTLVASGFALAAVAPAHADPSDPTAIGAKDIVGVGSDTTQLVVGDLANLYNGTVVGSAADKGAGAKLYSWDACTLDPGTFYPCHVDTTQDLKLRSTSSASIVRPNGSGAGMKTMETSSDNPEVSFSRSSSAMDDAAAASKLVAFPFAVDGLEIAVNPDSFAPANLTGADILGIYTGQYKHWNEIPGNAAGSTDAIVPYVPQSGSGTRSFFIAQLRVLNGGSGTDAELISAAHETEEHDPTVLESDKDAIAPFSVGRAQLINGAAPSPVIKSVPGWSAQRAVYDIVRSQDNSGTGKDNPAWFSSSPVIKSLFGSGGFFCSPAAQATIEANGFHQLKRPADGGACGVPITTSGGTPSTLAAYNAVTGKLTPRVAGTAAAARYGVAHPISVRALGTSDLNPTGTVVVTLAGHTYSARLDATGSARVTAPATLAAGTYRGSVRYAGDLNFKAAAGTVTVSVTKIRATMATRFPKVVKRGRKVAGTITLRAAAGRPTGMVQVLKKGKRIATARVVNGVAHVSFLRTKLKKGRNVLTVKYVATGNYSAPAPKRITITRKR